MINKCHCKHGTKVANGTACPTHNTEACVSCDVGKNITPETTNGVLKCLPPLVQRYDAKRNFEGAVTFCKTLGLRLCSLEDLRNSKIASNKIAWAWKYGSTFFSPTPYATTISQAGSGSSMTYNTHWYSLKTSNQTADVYCCRRSYINTLPERTHPVDNKTDIESYKYIDA